MTQLDSPPFKLKVPALFNYSRQPSQRSLQCRILTLQITPELSSTVQMIHINWHICLFNEHLCLIHLSQLEIISELNLEIFREICVCKSRFSRRISLVQLNGVTHLIEKGEICLLVLLPQSCDFYTLRNKRFLTKVDLDFSRRFSWRLIERLISLISEYQKG